MKNDSIREENGENLFSSLLPVGWRSGHPIYIIDTIPTIIYSVRGDYAKGGIVSLEDLEKETPCYVAKYEDYYAHGKKLREAFEAAKDKAFEVVPVEERISQFNAEFPDRSVKIKASVLFDWHHYLTGSCLLGRIQYCEDNGISKEEDGYTVDEFIEMTENSYRGEIIKLLKK